jgi:hypothetical protein
MICILCHTVEVNNYNTITYTSDTTQIKNEYTEMKCATQSETYVSRCILKSTNFLKYARINYS